MEKSKIRTFIWGLFALILLVGAIYYGGALGSGVLSGLVLCAKTLIPSLFPFMVISNFLVLSGIYKTFSYPLLPFTKYLFKMPKNMGPIILLSFIGGFPVGAKNVQTLYNQQEIDESCANRLLSFCINPGPAFIITSVGAGMLGSMQTGIILFTAQIIASVTVGIIASRGKENAVYIKPKSEKMGLAEAFVKSVNDNVKAMLSICAFVVVFSAIIEVIKQIGLQNKLLQGFVFSILEVTTGCLNAANSFTGNTAVFFVCLALSTCGISVICQIKAILAGEVLSLKRFFASRLIHFSVMFLISILLFSLFPAASPVFSNSATVVTGVSTTSFGGMIFVVLSCFSLIYTVNERVAKLKR